MKNRIALLLLAAFCIYRPASAAELKPNVFFILAADLGWADTTLHGHTKYYKTPNLERLVKRGMTFTHAYAASPLFSPTRSSILTGLSPARTGIAWRLDGQKDFVPAQTVHQDFAASSEFQDVTVKGPAEGSIIHLRLLLPDGTTDVRHLELKAANGKQAKQWTFEARH